MSYSGVTTANNVQNSVHLQGYYNKLLFVNINTLFFAVLLAVVVVVGFLSSRNSATMAT